MKIRQGFVSNSSSSSFICAVSGHIEAGYDLTMDEAEFVECTNGHEFMESYIVGGVGSVDTEIDDWRYRIPPEKCPICTMKTISNDDLLRYLIISENIDKEMLLDKIRNSYGSYTEFIDTLKVG